MILVLSDSTASLLLVAARQSTCELIQQLFGLKTFDLLLQLEKKIQ